MNLRNEPKKIYYRNVEENPESSYDPETFKVEQPNSQNFKPQPRSNTYLGQELGDRR